MESERGGRRALLALLLWVPLLGGAVAAAAAGGGDRAEDKRDDGFRGATAGDDPLSRLGQAAWAATESWLGPQPLRLVAESLSATLWLVSSGISVALTTLCRILGDLLATTGHSGDRLLLRAVALAPAEVQRVLLWGLAAAVASWLLARLRGLLLPLLRWAKLCCFLAAFLHVATCRESPTTQAGLLLGLWVLYGLLGGGLGTPPALAPSWKPPCAAWSGRWRNCGGDRGGGGPETGTSDTPPPPKIRRSDPPPLPFCPRGGGGQHCPQRTPSPWLCCVPPAPKHVSSLLSLPPPRGSPWGPCCH